MAKRAKRLSTTLDRTANFEMFDALQVMNTKCRLRRNVTSRSLNPPFHVSSKTRSSKSSTLANGSPGNSSYSSLPSMKQSAYAIAVDRLIHVYTPQETSSRSVGAALERCTGVFHVSNRHESFLFAFIDSLNWTNSVPSGVVSGENLVCFEIDLLFNHILISQQHERNQHMNSFHSCISGFGVLLSPESQLTMKGRGSFRSSLIEPRTGK
jgi:hypothetical protein